MQKKLAKPASPLHSTDQRPSSSVERQNTPASRFLMNPDSITIKSSFTRSTQRVQWRRSRRTTLWCSLWMSRPTSTRSSRRSRNYMMSMHWKSILWLGTILNSEGIADSQTRWNQKGLCTIDCGCGCPWYGKQGIKLTESRPNCRLEWSRATLLVYW